MSEQRITRAVEGAVGTETTAEAATGKRGLFQLKLEARHIAAFEKWAMPLRGLIAGTALLSTWPALLCGLIGCLLSLTVLLPIGNVPGWLKAAYPLLAFVYLIAAVVRAFALQREGLQVHARQIRQVVEQSGELHSRLAPLLQSWFKRGAEQDSKPDYKGLLRSATRIAKSVLEFSLPDILGASLRRQLLLVGAACLLAWLPVIFSGPLGVGWGLTGLSLAALGCSLAPLSLLLVRRLSAHWALTLGTVDGLVGWLRSLRKPADSEV